MKKIFVSHSVVEAGVAGELCTQIGNAFEGLIQFVNTSEQLSSGTDWKKFIKDNLKDSDAGIFLLTPRYITSTWCTAEFTAFWLEEKPVCLFSIGQLNKQDLFNPMNDSQITNIEDVDKVKLFFKWLSEFVGLDRIPYKFAELFSQKCCTAYAECLEQQTDVIYTSYEPTDPRYFGRRYKLFSNKWTLSLNEDMKTLKGVCEGERRIVCTSGSIKELNISVEPAESLVRFPSDADYEVVLLEHEYKGGTVYACTPHKQEGQNFAFSLEFSPQLVPGDEVYVKYRFTMPIYKVASTECMKECFSTSPYDLRNDEYISNVISYPIEKFIYEINFTDDCCVRPKLPEATWRELPSVEEMEKLRNKENYVSNYENGWKLRLERNNPPIRTRYKFSWNPPSQKELEQKSAEPHKN